MIFCFFLLFFFERLFDDYWSSSAVVLWLDIGQKRYVNTFIQKKRREKLQWISFLSCLFEYKITFENYTREKILTKYWLVTCNFLFFTSILFSWSIGNVDWRGGCFKRARFDLWHSKAYFFFYITCSKERYNYLISFGPTKGYAWSKCIYYRWQKLLLPFLFDIMLCIWMQRNKKGAKVNAYDSSKCIIIWCAFLQRAVHLYCNAN